MKLQDENVCAASHADQIAEENVIRTVRDIRAKNQAIRELKAGGKLKVAGAMYDIITVGVRFIDV